MWTALKYSNVVVHCSLKLSQQSKTTPISLDHNNIPLFHDQINCHKNSCPLKIKIVTQ